MFVKYYLLLLIYLTTQDVPTYMVKSLTLLRIINSLIYIKNGNIFQLQNLYSIKNTVALVITKLYCTVG